MTNLTQEIVRKYFRYDPETGKFFRILLCDRWGNETEMCREVTTLGSRGYIEVYIDKKLYKVHRLVFLYTNGEWPDHVDHINGDRSDNRWCNLRSVTRSENMKNRAIGSNNTSGVMGVTWCEQFGKWRVRINVNGDRMSLGLYSSFEDAVTARLGAERLLGYHENHGKRDGWRG